MWQLRWGILFSLFVTACLPVDEVAQGPTGPFADDVKVTVPAEAQAMYHYMRARMDVLDGDFQAAHEHYKAVREHDPDSALVRARLAGSHLVLGEIDDALREAEAAVRLNDQEPENRRLLAGLYGATGRVDEAIREYRKLLELDPEDSQSLLYLGAIHLAQGGHEQAREHLERYKKRNPSSPLGPYYLGRTLANSGELSLAEESYAAALKLHPSSAPVLAELALVQELRGRREQALKTYEKLLKADSRDEWAGKRIETLRAGGEDLAEARAEFDRRGDREASPGSARMKVGLVYYELGSLQAAVTEFRLALAERPDDQRIRFFLGLTLARLEDREGAAAHFRRIPRDSEYFVDAQIQLASVYQGQERYSEAVAAIREAMEEDDRRRQELLRFLAEIYRKAKDYPNAIEVMHKVVELDPENDRVYFSLGALYDESKDKDKTIEYMRKAVELNPDNASALNYLGYTYAELGVELDRAEELIVRALEIAPNDGYYIDSLGWVYYQKGDYRRAIEQLERAVSLVPDDPIIIEHLGDAYLKVGETDKALRSYRDALKAATKDEEVERIRGKIGRLEQEV